MRDELQSIDEFQGLDRWIRYFITNQTGHGHEEEPKKREWLSKEVVLLLDDTFGWSHQTARNSWEHDHYQWLYKIVGEYPQKNHPNPNYEGWGKTDRNSFEFLGYQPLPLLFQPGIILMIYLLYRLIQLKWGPKLIYIGGGLLIGLIYVFVKDMVPRLWRAITKRRWRETRAKDVIQLLCVFGFIGFTEYFLPLLRLSVAKLLKLSIKAHL